MQAGSYHERNNELGYAHFVEHMAFRDLRDFPKATATAMLERLGAGPHVNATTGLFETEFHFHNLPTDDPEAIPTGLTIMRAMADGIVFDPESVARERGVIFGEQRSREGMLAVQSRADELEFIAPREAPPKWQEVSVLFEGTRLARRHPLGVEKTLLAATAARLRTFYDRWYRPERMILVVAGDIDAAGVEPRVRETFSTMIGRGRAPAEPAIDPAKNPGRLQISDSPLQPTMPVSLGVVRNRRPIDDTDARRRSLAHRLALGMLARRFERAIQTADAPFNSADLFASHYVPARELVLLRASTRPDDWMKALSALDHEVHRANELGFHRVEFELAAKRESFRTGAAARQAAQRTSAEEATALAVSIARGVVFTSAGDDQWLTQAQLASLNETHCHTAFREMLWNDEWSIALLGPMGARPGQKFTINFKESRTAPLTPYLPPTPPRPFPFTDFGPAGEVVKNEHAVAIDTRLVQFANGVRLNLKHTRFEPGRCEWEYSSPVA